MAAWFGLALGPVGPNVVACGPCPLFAAVLGIAEIRASHLVELDQPYKAPK